MAADLHLPARISRRGVLGGVASLATAPTPTSAGAAGLSVLTWNCYLGVDLFRLQRATTPDQARRVAGQLLRTATGHPYEQRAGEIAAEIADARPTAVAL